MIAGLGACVNHSARFVDVDRPKAVVLAELTEKAKSRTEQEVAATEAALAASSQNEAHRVQRAAELGEELTGLVQQKIVMLERRLAVAREMAATFDAYRARCDSVTDWHFSPARCQELAEIALLGNSTVARTEPAIAEARRRLAGLGDEPPEKSPLDTRTAPIDIPALPEDLTIGDARALVAEAEPERALDQLLAARSAELATTRERETVEEVQIEVSYESLRLARFDHENSDGKERGELREVSRYRVIEVDGITRIIRDDEGTFDPEVAELLGIGTESPCLFGDLKGGLVRCPGNARVQSSGSIDAGGFRYPRTPVTPRALPYFAHDQELGNMLGVSHGVAAGLQLRTPEDGRGVFSRWKLAGLVGVNLDLAINVSKESDAEPRLVAAITPELVLRAGWSEVFHLEPDRNIETRRETLVDLAVGPRFDTHGRAAASLRATVRPTASVLGVTVRYNRYADDRGASVIVGFELADEGSILPAAATAAVTPLVLLVYLLASCDDPSKDNCGNQ